MTTEINIIFYSFLAGLSTLFGSYLVIKHETWTKKNSIFLISLATGMLLATAFLNILPEAIELNKDAFVYSLLGILILYALEQRIMIHACHDDKCEIHKAKGAISSYGLGIHSLIDGMIIGVGFSVSQSLGMIATLSVIFHEIPEGISIYSILRYYGYKRKKAIFNSVWVALATPLGAIITLFFVNNFNDSSLGILLALAGGAVFYIGASDLLPETHEKFHRLNTLFVLMGTIVIYVIKSFL